jgi:hypothetical protein
VMAQAMEGRKEQEEVFVQRMLGSGGTRWNHICAIELAVHMFSNKLRIHQGQ